MDPRPKPSPAGVPAQRGGVPYGLARVILGLLLLVAGALKLYQLGFEAEDEGDGAVLLMLFAEIELLFGAWLVSGIDAERTRPWAAAAFLGLAASSTFQLIAGKCSCGCFGGLSIHPGLALAIDLAAIAAVLFTRWPAPTAWEYLLTPTRLAGFALLALAIAAVGWRQAELVTLTGIATADGRPLSDAELIFTGPSGKLDLHTDHDGRFRLALVRPGRYALSTPGRTADAQPQPARKAGRPSAKSRSKAAGFMPPPADAVRWIEIPACSEDNRTIEL